MRKRKPAGKGKVLLCALLSGTLLLQAADVAHGAEAAKEQAGEERTAQDQQTGEKNQFYLDPVVVTADPVTAKSHLTEKAANGALGSRSLLDTPFSVTVVSGEELADRQVAKLGDVFATDASVSNNGDGYNAWASYLSVRGLLLDWQNAYKLNGMPFMSYGVTLPYDHFEKVELLKGLSGFMYGFGSPGGVVNYVTKKPVDTPVHSVDAGYKSDSIRSIHIDVGERFGADNKFGYRLNATHEEGGVYNGGSIDRDSFSLALDAKLTPDLTWNFEMLDQNRKSKGQTPSIYTGLYTSSGLPSVISGDSKNLAGDDQHLYTDLQLYTTGLQYQINPDWKLSSSYSYNKSTRNRNEGTLYLANSTGDYNDYRSDSREAHQFYYWQAMLEGKITSGPVTHQLTLGAANQRQVNNYSSNSFWGFLGSGNIYSPNNNSYYSSIDFDLYRNSDIAQKSIFASDTMQFSERWSVLAGLRYTDYEQRSYDTAGALTARYVKNGVTTPTMAVMYKLRPNTTLYTSYVQSLEPGSTVGTTYANRDQLLNPLKSKQYEVGLKSEQGRWSTTAALFRIERGAEYANSGNYYVQDGKAIYQGMELGASTRLGARWELGGNLMWLDSSYDQGFAYKGNRVAGAPNFVATTQVAYNVPRVSGLKLFADAKYTGETMLRAANDLKVPGYTIVNIGAIYPARIHGKDVTLRVAVNNVTNRRYWEYQYADYIKPGDPRTVSVSAKYEF
ncbi:TonB-dependent siderophore receptor [Sporomusa aerivorans]|uniref:TonB-dependent siderophore receptor n=1 Tax=Sporomusa aerivorans TaxID=204936 RepID=UPI00352B4CA5